MSELIKVSEATKHTISPFLDNNVINVERGKKHIIMGGINDVVVDTTTGETTGIGLMHKIKVVDKQQFVKLFTNEVSALFDLSKTGLKVFAYVLQALRINNDRIYINPFKVMEFCEYKTKRQVYKGLSELISSNIIAMSDEPNIWFINPTVIFNGDRIAFIKEYRLQPDKETIPTQTKLKIK